MRMATTKNASRKSRSRSSNGANANSRSRSRAKSSGGSKTRSNGGATRTRKKSASAGRATKSRSTRSSSKPRTRSTSSSRVGQVVDTAKQVASRAKGPAVAVGAAAAGLAGGLALKARSRRKTVLGMRMPRSLTSDLDVKSIAKSVGEASQRVAKTSKTVSKDIERAGDKAERIGKILS